MYLIHKSNGIAKNENFASVKWNKITSLSCLIFVFGKSVFTPQKLFSSFFLILIFAIGSSAMVPYYFSYGTTTNLSLFLISAIIYGTIFYSFRRSTLFENIKGTSLGKLDIYFSILVIVTLFSLVMYFFILAFFTIGLAVNSALLMNSWFFSETTYGSGGIMLGQINFELLAWWYIAFVLINFSLFYLFQNIANNEQTFYLLIFFYFVMLMLFGNAVDVIMLSHEYEVVETYEGTYLNHVTGVDPDLIFSIPNKNFPINPPMQMSVSNSLKTEWANGRHFFSLVVLFIPHYWINFYCANIMKATALIQTTINPGIELNLESEVFLDVISKQSNLEIPITYSPYSFENIEMWTFSNQVAWILGMYLWIFYAIFIASIGTYFSRFYFKKIKFK